MANHHQSAKRPSEDGSLNERPYKLHKCDFNDTITVLVGTEEKPFIVHKDVICTKSKFFRAACSGRLQEGQEKIVRLPEACKAKDFQMYMFWTYTCWLNIEKAARVVGRERAVIKNIDLYLLGEVMDDVKLRNRSLDVLTAHIETPALFPSPEKCHVVRKQTSSNSPIRKWIVDHLVSLMAPDVFKERAAEFPADLILQAAAMLMENRHREDGAVDLEVLKKRLATYTETEDDAEQNPRVRLPVH